MSPRYNPTERAWVKRIVARLNPDQRRRYEEAMRKEPVHSNSGKKYDDVKARVAERILYEDSMLGGVGTPPQEKE